MTSRRRLRDGRDYLLYLGLGVAMGAALAFATGRVPPVVSGGAVALVTLIAGVAACWRGGRVDEFDLAAVKFAWLWGGFAGLALGLGLAVWGWQAGGGLGLDLARFTSNETRAFAGGIALLIGLQLGLYLIVLALWRRRAAG
ncbi:MAG: hypothetical protein CFE37_13925 [Alphaproteobacteria bacterium PA4]|nr:MAG: hypothetical protein CFE37_13925 [Alphaproteobacteria bacterium PA4]